MSTATLMLAAGCAAKCPPHAIAAVAGALVVGFVVGRLSKRCKCSGQKHTFDASKRRERKPLPRIESPRQPVPAGSVEIYVGNLSYDLTDESLKALFAEYGTVVSARVVLNRFNGKSKGFGFVVMANREEAEKAIAAYSEKEYMGRKMRVNEAKNTITES
jgi:RNA recognition motif-containing protein